MTEAPANLLLAVLRKRLADTPKSKKFERKELRQRIRDTAAALARAEYEAKAGPVLREIEGAY